jgi:O-antigen/teichoic acid export membrane protein
MGPAIASNIVNYDLQAVLLIVASVTGVLTLDDALWITAATSVLALCVAAASLRRLVARDGVPVREALRSTWQIGRWTAAAEAVQSGAESTFPALVAAVAGLAAAGGYGVVQQVVGVLNLLARPMNTHFTPRAADAWARDGAPGLRRVMRSALLVAGPPYAIALSLFLAEPQLVLTTLYGEAYAEYATALQIFAVVKLLYLGYHLLELPIHALRLQRHLLIAAAAGAAVVFGLGAILLPHFDLIGAGLVWLVVAGVRVTILWLPVRSFIGWRWRPRSPVAAAVNASST